MYPGLSWNLTQRTFDPECNSAHAHDGILQNEHSTETMYIRNGGELWHSHGRAPRISVGGFKYTYNRGFLNRFRFRLFPLFFTTPLHIVHVTFIARSPSKLEHLQRHNPSCLPYGTYQTQCFCVCC